MYVCVTDSSWTSDRPSTTPKVELRWFKHRSSPRNWQWSYYIVCNTITLKHSICLSSYYIWYASCWSHIRCNSSLLLFFFFFFLNNSLLLIDWEYLDSGLWHLQDSHLICVYWIFHKFLILGFFYFLLYYVWLESFSPQAIFKDPFRGGNNILVFTL